MDGTNVSSAGTGACSIVGVPTQICITAAPYYGSPYSSTTTTLASGASSGATTITVTSNSTWVQGNWIFITGAGTSSANYIGQVTNCGAAQNGQPCVSSTFTISPATGTTVSSGTSVTHDNTTPVLNAEAALCPTSGIALCGSIYFPQISANLRGYYLAQGPAQDPSGSNSVLPVPVLPNYSGSNLFSNPCVINLVGIGGSSEFDGPVLESPGIAANVNFIGGFDSASGGGFPNFTNIQLNISGLTLIAPITGTGWVVNCTWILGCETINTVMLPSLTAPTVIGTSGGGVAFPGLSNSIRNVADHTSVSGFGTDMRMGEHGIVTGSNFGYSTNCLVLDANPSGSSAQTFANSISLRGNWFGPGTGIPAASTCTNAIAAGTNATAIDADGMNYEGTGTLVNDPSNLLSGPLHYSLALSSLPSCPYSATFVGGTKLDPVNIKCPPLKVTTVTATSPITANGTTGTAQSGPVVVACPTCSTGGGGTGAWTNLTGTVTWSGCTAGSSSCVVGTAGASIGISSIPTTYNMIVIEILQASCTTASHNTGITLQLNGDTGANYSYASSAYTNGTNSAGGAQGQTSTPVGSMPCTTALTGSSATVEITIPNYGSTSVKKFGRVENDAGVDGSTSAFYVLGQHVTFFYNSTAQITSATLISGSGNFAVGTAVVIYGVL